VRKRAAPVGGCRPELYLEASSASGGKGEDKMFRWKMAEAENESKKSYTRLKYPRTQTSFSAEKKRGPSFKVRLPRQG